MKAVNGRLPGGDDWVFEPKWDGHRAMVRVEGGRVAMASSTGKDRTGSWPWLIAPMAAAVGDHDAIVDGEVIALDESGRHSFQLVGRPDRPHSFVAFDLLALDRRSLTGRPWSERRELLGASLAATAPVSITPIDDDAETLMAVTRAHGFEGVVAKRRSSTYQPGRRSPSWIKVKHRHGQEFVVGGYKTGEGTRAGTFGSLLLGVYDDGRLQFVGAAGTGFDERLLTRITPMLRSREIPDCPFNTVPKLPGGRNRLRWVRPELVAQVSFAEWTEGGGIRHPVFLGLRDDKPAAGVVREG
ncbi:hypothetical protein BH24ACT5_BH24ACT5_29600 [soil metagenome]